MNDEPIHPMQALVNGMSAAWQRERSQSQMTLGALIAALEAMPPDADVANIYDPHSYRGYYCDLEFERAEGTRKASDLLVECRAAMGNVFEGYKGGDYVMGARTPVWVGSYGTAAGDRLMAVRSDGTIETSKEESDP